MKKYISLKNSNETMYNKLTQNLFPTGALFVLLAALLKLVDTNYVEYLFSLGALLLISFHALIAFKSNNASHRVQRLHRIGLFTSLFLAVGAYFMFTNSNSWIVMLLIYAVNTLYLSYRIK